MKRSIISRMIIAGFFFYVFNSQFGWQKIGSFSSGKECQAVYETFASLASTQAQLPVPIIVAGVTGGFCYQGI